MPDQILYTGGPNQFKGLEGMPEEPTTDKYGFGADLTLAWAKYTKQVESIKSNAPDIVNYKDILGIVSDMQGGLWFSGGDQLKPGDIFDLPVGYEFKKGVQGTILKDGGCETRVVLRIVKTEPFEMQDIPENIAKIVNDNWGKLIGVKTEVKETHETTHCGGVNCPFEYSCMDGCMYPKKLSQPEPEESQKELWLEAREYMKVVKPNGLPVIAMSKELFENFTIQRKK